MALKLAGKVVLVVGGTGGIGKEIVKLFVKEGAAVAVNSRNEQVLCKFVEELGGSGWNVLAVPGDMSEDGHVREVFQHTISTYGRLDILIHCAGTAQRLVSIVDLEVAEYDEVMRNNARSVFLCAREAAKYMLQQEPKEGFRGQIILFSSYMGVVGSPTVSAYCASKHAVMGLARAISKELLPKGIRVTAICPREVDTPMRRKVVPPNVDRSRWMSPHEIAEQVLFIVTRPFWAGYEEVVIGVPQNV